MKKLIIAMAIAVMAVVSQAASTKWVSGTVTTHATNATAGKDAVTMYVFSITAADYASLAAMEGETLSKYISANYSTDSAYKSGNTVAKGGAVTITSNTETWSANDKLYTAVLFVDNTDSAVAGNVATITAPASGNAQFTNLFTQYGGTAEGGSIAWATASVPEPTSGLLMLLGMAGLALRRRRI